MKARFLHTSDWQLGVTRQFLSADSQARWSEAWFEGVRNLGRIAKEELCEFIVVAGDVFESNQVERKTVLKACEAMAGIEVPIYLLPANHDPLDAASVFSSKPWKDRKPAKVHVLDTMGKIFEVRPGTCYLVAQDQSRKSLALELVSTHSNTTGGDAKIESTVKSS